MDNINVSDIFELNYLIENTFFDKLNDDIKIPKEIKGTHIKALIIIKYGDHMTMSQVSNRLNLVKGAFTPVANRLLKFNYIERIRSVEDKRVSYIVLTANGLDFVKSVLDILTANIRKKLSRLSEDEIEAYFAAIKFVLSTTKQLSE